MKLYRNESKHSFLNFWPYCIPTSTKAFCSSSCFFLFKRVNRGSPSLILIVEEINALETILNAISADPEGPCPSQVSVDEMWCCQHHEALEQDYSWDEETLRAFVAQWKKKRNHMLLKRPSYLPTLYHTLQRSGMSVVVLQVLIAQYTSPCFDELVAAAVSAPPTTLSTPIAASWCRTVV